MCSAACEREDMERQDDVLLAFVQAERHALLGVGLQREVRGGLSDVYHAMPPVNCCRIV